MKDYKLYLRDRLIDIDLVTKSRYTECDLTISSIPFREYVGEVYDAIIVDSHVVDTYLTGLAKQQPSSWSETARKWAEGIGLIKGDDKGNKNYKSFCTREQMVQFLYRFKDMK